ncbi:helix-turn-helix domain-containing protein [Staphylococcus capitis]|uniref:helix-turn-helix domain-containing protein n=1 Tax=Staphylococcus capitis TaxID=29388 RepID=UPI00203FF6C6|nr:helix-turn-helix transcriptional regulator [Staphylococcus capitis]MCM3508971.1 helix-turn-helix transcriptional regulator [Staphylococcus capitis]
MKNQMEIDTLLKYVCKELRKRRQDKKMTLDDVGFDLGYNSSYIGKIERAEQRTISFYMLVTLANYYDVKIETVISLARLQYNIDQQEALEKEKQKQQEAERQKAEEDNL